MSKSLLLEAISKIDEKLLSPEVRTTIMEAFDASVDLKANEKVKELQESVVSAVEEHVANIAKAHIYDLNESFKSASEAKAKELSEAYEAELQESLNAKFDLKVKVLVESIDNILQQAVNETVEEIKPAIDNEVEVAKAKRITEAAVEFANKFAIALAEADGDPDDKELEDEKKKAKELEDENKELKKEKVVTEAVADLTAIQSDKFSKLIESIEFDNVESFTTKVQALKSIIVESKVEDKKNLHESNPSGKKPSWMR